MARPKKNKSLPEYMTERKGYYETRRPIRADERHSFPELTGQRAVKVMPIGKIGSSRRPTKADLERHNQNLDDIDARISAGNIKLPTATTPRLSGKLYAPEQILEALTLWGDKSFKSRYLSYCNGVIPLVVPISKQHMEWSAQIATMKRQLNAYRSSNSDILSSDEKNAITSDMLSALGQMEIDISVNSPMASNAGVLASFLTIRIEFEERSLRVAMGDFTVDFDEDELDDEGGAASPVLRSTNNAANVQWRLSDLLEKYLSKPKHRRNLDKKKRFWNLLIRNVGDLWIHEISSPQMSDFEEKLRKTPIVKHGDFSDATFDEINQNIALLKARSPLVYRGKKTIYDHMCVYKTVFEYGVEQRVINYNPITSSMLDKPMRDEAKKKIEIYVHEDIARIFSTPLYTGCDRIRAKSKSDGVLGKLYGYRDRPGQLIERDGRYFMPLLGLLTGARMEEWGGAKSTDVKCKDGIWYLNLTNRSVKTESSKRIIPLHPLLVAENQIDFVSYVIDRQKAGDDEFLFPEFTPPTGSRVAISKDIKELSLQRGGDTEGVDEDDPKIIKRSAVYSRWFGHWRKANGFASERKNYHSFRHTFKDAIRRAGVEEEVHDFITGHSNSNEGRKYGSDEQAMLQNLQLFYEAVSKVRYPTLPWQIG